MLAVIGAMKEEIDLIEAAMTVSERHTRAGIEILRGRFRDVEIATVGRQPPEEPPAELLVDADAVGA